MAKLAYLLLTLLIAFPPMKSCIDTAVTVLPKFFQDFEVVVVNDGSRDNTAQITAEILVQCVRLGCAIREVPVMHYPRYRYAPTGANLKVVTKAFRELPQLWKYRSIQPTPLVEPTPVGEHSAA